MDDRRNEIESAVKRYLALRDACGAGEQPWTALSECFTEDVVFIDPAWGRVEGLDAVRDELLDKAMVGLDGWEYPTDLVLIDGDHVVIKWRQVIRGADDRAFEQSGYSRLIYGGDGRFCYEEDLLNMAHVMEDFEKSGWSPPEGVTINLPPASPNRDFSIPKRAR